MIGLPLFTDSGTEREEGMVVSTGELSSFSTSCMRRPTLESARLTTTRMRPLGKCSSSMVWRVSLRFLMLGTSRVASMISQSDSSKADSTGSENAGGVSITT
jgi:hypothetical protein